jgi:hypothetical protein
VGYSPDSNNVNREVKESPLLRSVTGKRLLKADHFTMSRCEGTWWQLYCRRNARWFLVTLENFSYNTTHCARCCCVTAMFVSHALAPPHGHATEQPVNPPVTLHGYPSRSYSDKLLRDMYIDFLYTTVYFSNISNGSFCIMINHWTNWHFIEKEWNYFRISIWNCYITKLAGPVFGI